MLRRKTSLVNSRKGLRLLQVFRLCTRKSRGSNTDNTVDSALVGGTLVQSLGTSSTLNYWIAARCEGDPYVMLLCEERSGRRHGFTGPTSCIGYGLKEELELGSHRTPVPGSLRSKVGECLVAGQIGREPVWQGVFDS